MGDEAGHGGPEMLREVVIEHLQLVALHAHLGIGHAEAGDDLGLSYSVRRLVAYVRVVVTTAADLAERRQPEGGRRHER
jgi:hypothetical protein